MRKFSLLIACVLALGLCSCAARYHYDVFVFDDRGLGIQSSESGEGDPQACRLLFDTPGIYMGVAKDIPNNATAFGVVAVTDGNTCKIVPLFEWSDDKGIPDYGCNGPQPCFARGGKSRQELTEAIVAVLKGK